MHRVDPTFGSTQGSGSETWAVKCGWWEVCVVFDDDVVGVVVAVHYHREVPPRVLRMPALCHLNPELLRELNWQLSRFSLYNPSGPRL